MEQLKSRRIMMTFAGSFLGAGYVSGQELWQFFGSFGAWGWVGLALTMAALGLLGGVTLLLARRSETVELDRLMIPWERPWLRRLVSVLELFLLFSVVSIMLAGGGALLEQLFGLPHALAGAAMCVVLSLIAARGVGGMVKLFSLSVPVLIVSTALFGIVAVCRFGLQPAPTAATNPLVPNWLIGFVTFTSYNLFGSVGIIAPLGPLAASEREARRGVAFGAIGLLLIAASVLGGLSACPEALASELPMLALAGRISRWGSYGYGVLLLMAMLGTSVSSAVAILTYGEEKLPRLASRRRITVPLLGAAGYLCSLVGFGDLISMLYPLFGYGSAVFVVCLVIHFFQTKHSKTGAAQ